MKYLSISLAAALLCAVSITSANAASPGCTVNWVNGDCGKVSALQTPKSQGFPQKPEEVVKPPCDDDNNADNGDDDESPGGDDTAGGDDTSGDNTGGDDTSSDNPA